MANEQSVNYSFTKVDNFHEILIDREEITTALFDGVTKNFRIVLVESCPANIGECLNEDGTLNDDVISYINGEGEGDGQCALRWNIGANSNRTITVSDANVNYTLGDGNFMLKGAFLVVEQSGIVLAYSINNGVMPITKSFVAPVNGLVWSIINKLDDGA
ncbi:MAG: hypothetical protein UHM08_08875 [Bacteroidales bacterium]|nr:hypothetical protein [Bacteroidales bacterium]